MSQILAIARKELKSYFGSPMAALFVGAFLVASLFSFFWVETFFVRNIADIRPLFRWMPLLMIFLVAALTMRQWSEEQRMGTMEVLLTLPVRIPYLVLGKFIAVLGLVTVALALTLGLPVTVSLLGNIDWGPVAGGYLGALLMASAYISIGLFVSSRTDNQIISLIISVLLGGLFYLIGSSGITNFMGNQAAYFFRALGTGSRFMSIERGVIDLRDLVYYGSLTVFFLLLNIASLDRIRWSFGSKTAAYRRGIIIAVTLAALNLLAFNVWLNASHSMRLDLTQNKEYSLSETTRNLIVNLPEPLILRGYFSAKTHPLLSPLVPRIRDLMEEYGEVSGGRVKVSFVDPKYDQEAEAEANQQYGIKPVPFQVTGRYEASVVNSYFNILIKYGDQYKTLGFDDLIEIQRRKDGQIDVGLHNLEYDLTKSIKKVIYGFQSLPAVFEKMNQDIKLTAIITPDTLPASLTDVPDLLSKVVDELQKESGGKLHFQTINPDDPAAGINREEINRRYGIKPIARSLFSEKSFYLHLFLTDGNKTERIYLSGELDDNTIRQDIEAAIKRNSAGFLKTVGIWTPRMKTPPQNAMRQPPEQRSDYEIFQKALRDNYNLKQVDLTAGEVGGDVDVLLLVAPQDMTDLQRFAVDQYLMRGGAVVALAGNYILDLTPYSQAINVKKVFGGLTDMLADYGITVDDAMVMDKQNEPFPVPVERNLGGFTVREIRRINYPFFVDVRSDGMNHESPAVANLSAVTMNWVSPLTVDKGKNKDRRVINLLSSSPDSWLAHGTDIQPDFKRYPRVGFQVGDSLASRLLAVSVQGSFTSFFKDKPDPRDVAKANVPAADKDEEEGETGTDKEAPSIPLIGQSPESSRLVVVGSSEFINDTVISLSQSLGQDRFLNSLNFLQNIIDWSVEDQDLLVIRSRGSEARLLKPMSHREQAFWEWFNYGIAIIALVLVSVFGALRRKKERPIPLDAAQRGADL